MIVADSAAMGGERVKILDFGIAKLAMGTGQPGAMPTRTGVLMGTPTYMAPEQCRGARGVDDRADVYALGVILYQMVAGAPPFGSPGAAEVMAQHVYEAPQPLVMRAPKVSPRLAALIDQMLLKQPSSRPSMAEVEKRLALLLGRGSAPAQAVDDPSATLVYAADGSAVVQPIAPKSNPDAKTQVGEMARGPALLPPHAPTQMADGLPADAKTKMVTALVSPAAPTKIHDEPRMGSEDRTQLKVEVKHDDPETLRPEEAKAAAEQIRRSAQTRLVTAIPTMMAAPLPITQPLPRPTLLDVENQNRLNQPSRTLQFSLLGALLMSVVLLVLYALLG